MTPKDAYEKWITRPNAERPTGYDIFVAGWRAGGAWMFTGMDAVVVLDAPSNGSAQTATVGGYKA